MTSNTNIMNAGVTLRVEYITVLPAPSTNSYISGNEKLVIGGHSWMSGFSWLCVDIVINICIYVLKNVGL